MTRTTSSQLLPWMHKNRLTVTMTATAALLILSQPALAAPEGGAVVSGSAAISQSGSTTNVNQSTNKAIINWQGFSVAPAETVNFNQPNASAVTLNRVIGSERSVIEGALNANGKVFLVNSAGVLMTKGASINTAGFVASTLNLSNEDFNAGRYTFQALSGAAGEIVNLGAITAKDGGYVVLLGRTVSNQGVITATKGTVSLNGADKVTLNFNGDSLVSVSLDEGALDALVENKQAIHADGGTVILTAKAADDLLTAQVNNTGLIQARTVNDLTGRVELYAHGGTTHVAGTLDASAPDGGDGGFIETSGDTVKVASGTQVTTEAAQGRTGLWLIDPNNFTIAAAGGDMTATDVARNLATTNFEIKTADMGTAGGNGDIFVNEALSWSADTVLTLNALRNININANINASGTNAGLALLYGGDYNILTPATYSGAGSSAPAGTTYASVTLNGANASLNINGNAYTLIHSMSDLAAINGGGNTAGTGLYALAENLNASGTTYTSAVVSTLSGTLAGLGHTVSNLSISSTSGANIALIGQTKVGSAIRDIGLLNVDMKTGGNYAAALVGTNLANISKAYSTGTISGSKAGGLVGLNAAPTDTTVLNSISDSFSDANVSGNSAGGLVGYSNYLNIYRSHATGTVRSIGGSAGGLIGSAYNTNVYNSYATGDVAGAVDAAGVSIPGNATYATNIGGLIGNAAGGVIVQRVENSYATGNVTGFSNLGGLIGNITSNANYFINNSYANGNVTGNQGNTSATNYPGIGGLVGTVRLTGATLYLTNSHAGGNVRYASAQGSAAGGLVGSITNAAFIDNSYATGNVTGATSGTSAGGLVGSTSSATNISNSHATGNVTGNISTGGLLGNNAGTTTNSWASGNVTGAGNQVGGLAGANTGTISSSHADGLVNGVGAKTWTGGLVGSNSGRIIDSYFSGRVNGPSGLTGGVSGINFGNGRITNSYFNISKNIGLNVAGAFVPLGNTSGTVEGGGGLTDAQMADVAYYADRTIGRVLTAREELKSKQNAALDQASSLMSNSQEEAGRQPAPQTVETGESGPSVDDSIVFADAPSYSADIKSIEVDGVRYDLEDHGAADGASGTNEKEDKAK